LVLGVAVYPWLLVLAWWYVRRAEHNEADFVNLVERRESAP
jgi:cytochrome oxidase assembly protein ShyY1